MQLENSSVEFQKILKRYNKSIKFTKPENLGKSIDRLLQERNKRALLKKDEYDLFYREAMQEFQNKIEGSFNTKAIQILRNYRHPDFTKKKTIIDKKHLIKIFENPEESADIIEDDVVYKFNRQLVIAKSTIPEKPKIKTPKLSFLKNSIGNKSHNPKLNILIDVIEDFPELKNSIKRIINKEKNTNKPSNSMRNNFNILRKDKSCPNDYSEFLSDHGDKYLTQENIIKLEKTLSNLASNRETSQIIDVIKKHKKLETNIKGIKKYEDQILLSNTISLKFIDHSENVKKQLQNKYKRVMEKHFN